jgi:hypothetical protein
VSSARLAKVCPDAQWLLARDRLERVDAEGGVLSAEQIQKRVGEIRRAP